MLELPMHKGRQSCNQDNDIVVHGNVNMMVDGNYHMKVGKDIT